MSQIHYDGIVFETVDQLLEYKAKTTKPQRKPYPRSPERAVMRTRLLYKYALETGRWINGAQLTPQSREELTEWLAKHGG